MFPIPDGDIFGEKMDGTWQPAADLVELDRPLDEVEAAMLTCLRKWEKKNLPEGQAMAIPFAKLLSGYIPGDPRTPCIDSLQQLAFQSYGHTLMAKAAAKLLSSPSACNGMSLQFIACTVYRNTLNEAVRCGFIVPLTIGACKRQDWSMPRIAAWERHLNAAVDRVVSRVEPGRTLRHRRSRSAADTPSNTADMLDIALPVKGM